MSTSEQYDPLLEKINPLEVFSYKANRLLTELQQTNLSQSEIGLRLRRIIAEVYSQRSLTDHDGATYNSQALNTLVTLVWKVAFEQNDTSQIPALLKGMPQREGFANLVRALFIQAAKKETLRRKAQKETATPFSHELLSFPPQGGVHTRENIDGHLNHDVAHMKSFVRLDGMKVARYVLGDGSGSSAKGIDGDALVIQKMTVMTQAVLNQTSLGLSGALIFADKEGKKLKKNMGGNEKNPTYGTMITADVICDAKNDLFGIELAGVGDAASVGWRKQRFSSRRSREYSDGGRASPFRLLTFQENLAQQLKNRVPEKASPTNKLDTDRNANAILQCMGDPNSRDDVRPRTHTISMSEQALESGEIPDILILCSDGLQPNNLIAIETPFSQYADQLLSDYVDGRTTQTLLQIAKSLTFYARERLKDSDDITIFLVDLRKKE